MALANFDIKGGEMFSLTGHPGGHAKLTSAHGEVLYPSRLVEHLRDELRANLIELTSNNIEYRESLRNLDSIYPSVSGPDDNPYYRYVYGGNSPGLGVICSTVPGDSGSAAFAMERGEHPSVLVGIFLGGSDPRSVAWIPGLKYHEVLFPSEETIRVLDQL